MSAKLDKLVLASSNPGKLREIVAVLAPLGIGVLPQSSLGLTDAEEPFRTFIENALAKARHAARQARLPALADDSGICARALAGEPGVHSARYAAVAGTAIDRDEQDRRNNRKLIEQLRDHQDRRAHYYCVMVLVRHAEDPEPMIAEGSWSGQIIAEPRGSKGFGYDPHFLIPDLGMTAAEIAPEQKNLISHRGKALRRLMARLKQAG
ncbi:MAG: RdgB/HAM1 family non-canonical purine NTP pyrophosphatase [Betaproteobacteria bacterium]|nr:RdgB/HAM1 family non-canonical purine NTP pyrophosphatase [Betaproteobacteria bacterium]